MHTITTIIFDLGRVLVGIDTSGEKFTRLMRAAGLTDPAVFDTFWRLDEVCRHMTGEIDSREFHRQASARFGADVSYEDFEEAWCDIFHPLPEMKTVFDELAGRYTVGLLSDTDPLHWNTIRAMLPWLSAIKTPTLSFEVGCLKPHPKMFGTAAANCGRTKEECLFIDDRAENVDGARSFGMQSLQFTTPEKLRNDLAGLKLL